MYFSIIIQIQFLQIFRTANNTSSMDANTCAEIVEMRNDEICITNDNENRQELNSEIRSKPIKVDSLEFNKINVAQKNTLHSPDTSFNCNIDDTHQINYDYSAIMNEETTSPEIHDIINKDYTMDTCIDESISQNLLQKGYDETSGIDLPFIKKLAGDKSSQNIGFDFCQPDETGIHVQDAPKKDNSLVLVKNNNHKIVVAKKRLEPNKLKGTCMQFTKKSIKKLRSNNLSKKTRIEATKLIKVFEYNKVKYIEEHKNDRDAINEENSSDEKIEDYNFNEDIDQSFLINDHKQKMDAKHENTKNLYIQSFNEEELKVFMFEFSKYINDKTLNEEETKKINCLVKKNVGLNTDPFYIWKTFYCLNEDLILFYYIQFHDDRFLRVMNQNENFTIQSLYTENHFLGKILAQWKLINMYNIIQSFNHMIAKRLYTNYNVNNKQVNLKNSDMYSYLDIIRNKINHENDENLLSNLICMDSVIEYIGSIKIDTNFSFDPLIRTIYLKAAQKKITSCVIKTTTLKYFVIECFNGASLDFHLLFPEIKVLLYYLKNTTFYRIVKIRDHELYVYISFLCILACIAKFKWYDIYTCKSPETSHLIRNCNIIKKASAFSEIKYEIFKVITYCILPYLTDEINTNYAQTRILERFSLCRYHQDLVKQPSHFSNHVYNVGVFNIIARFIFIPDLSTNAYLFNEPMFPANEKILFFVFRNPTLSCFAEFFKPESRKQNFIKAITQYYIISKSIKINVESVDLTKHHGISNDYISREIKIYSGIIKQHQNENFCIKNAVEAILNIEKSHLMIDAKINY